MGPDNGEGGTVEEGKTLLIRMAPEVISCVMLLARAVTDRFETWLAPRQDGQSLFLKGRRAGEQTAW